jgi:hypothetical protein
MVAAFFGRKGWSWLVARKQGNGQRPASASSGFFGIVN